MLNVSPSTLSVLSQAGDLLLPYDSNQPFILGVTCHRALEILGAMLHRGPRGTYGSTPLASTATVAGVEGALRAGDEAARED